MSRQLSLSGIDAGMASGIHRILPEERGFFADGGVITDDAYDATGLLVRGIVSISELCGVLADGVDCLSCV